MKLPFPSRWIMAPMTRGTDLPFRRLLTEFGARVCLGEMAYAHKVTKNVGHERALLRRHEDEESFGVQLAGKRPDVMAEAAAIAVDHGADFLDCNLGCPIDDATRRGFGAALLSRPTRVAAIVSAMKSRVSVPVTVKLRLGWSQSKPTFLRVAKAAEEAGVDAVTLHARSRAQRYRRPADWTAVARLVEELRVPVIGNGDVFDWQDARRRLTESGVAGVMIGRWALTKPWLFRELETNATEEFDAEERLAVLRRYVELCFEHFGTDEFGRKRTRRFLGFHQDFFARYRRRATTDVLHDDDPRNWGAPPEGELERWLCRADLPAVEALCDWLVDGKEPRLPEEPEGRLPRAVKTAAYG